MSDLPNWLHGPAFTDWLDQMRIWVKWTEHPNFARYMLKWRAGGALHVTTADALLVEFGYTLHDLPDSVWRWDSPRHPWVYRDAA